MVYMELLSLKKKEVMKLNYRVKEMVFNAGDMEPRMEVALFQEVHNHLQLEPFTIIGNTLN